MRSTFISILSLGVIWSIYVTYRQDKTFKDLVKSGFKKFLRVIFNKQEERIIITAFEENSSQQKYWVINNIIIPLVILYLPYIFTLINEDFGTILFHKTFQNLTLTGSLTMLGINVMRSNLTSVSEELKNESFAENANFKSVHRDNESLKSKLRSWVLILTITGTVFYFIQVGGFIISDHPKSYFYIIIIFSIVVLSVFFARILSVIQSNFLKSKDLTDELLNSYGGYEKNNEEFYEETKDEVKNGGLVE